MCVCVRAQHCVLHAMSDCDANCELLYRHVTRSCTTSAWGHLRTPPRRPAMFIALRQLNSREAYLAALVFEKGMRGESTNENTFGKIVPCAIWYTKITSGRSARQFMGVQARLRLNARASGGFRPGGFPRAHWRRGWAVCRRDAAAAAVRKVPATLRVLVVADGSRWDRHSGGGSVRGTSESEASRRRCCLEEDARLNTRTLHAGP